MVKEKRPSEDYIEWIKSIRRSKKPHTIVEDKLIEILSSIASEFEPVKEPQGLAGGRNDLILFRFDGRKVLFEIFATKNQVSRDLRILDNTDADKKIAVIIDREVDKKVIQQFLKENPENNYPYIFIGELFQSSQSATCKERLNYLIYEDENSRFQLLLKEKLRIKNEEFLDTLKRLKFDVISKEDIDTGQISFLKLFNLSILKKLEKIGLKKDKLLEILAWLADGRTLPYLLRLIDHGLNVFLYIDFEGGIGYYSDLDLVDYLRIGYQLPEPQLILSANSIVYEILENALSQEILIDRNNCIYTTVGHSQIVNAKSNCFVTLGLPKSTSKIYILTPSREKDVRSGEEPTVEDYKNMIEFIDGKQLFFQRNDEANEFTSLIDKLENRETR